MATRKEAIMEQREEAMMEANLYDDLDFCMEHFYEQYSDKLKEAYAVLLEVQGKIENYGHNIDLCDIVKYI